MAASADHSHDLVFEAPEVLDRVQHQGDLFAPVLTTVQQLPALQG